MPAWPSSKKEEKEEEEETGQDESQTCAHRGKWTAAKVLDHLTNGNLAQKSTPRIALGQKFQNHL